MRRHQGAPRRSTSSVPPLVSKHTPSVKKSPIWGTKKSLIWGTSSRALSDLSLPEPPGFSVVSIGGPGPSGLESCRELRSKTEVSEVRLNLSRTVGRVHFHGSGPRFVPPNKASRRKNLPVK